MTLRDLLEKFASGFTVIGIFIQTQQELIPIVQQSPELLLVLKRHPNLTPGSITLKFEDKEIGVLVDTLDDEVKILILASPIHIQEISAHLKRFLPIIRKQMNINEFLNKESVETRLVNRLEDIRLTLEDTLKILKEKMEVGRTSRR
ncbi:MAG: hypothetical protein ACTSW1_02390 [Candidatus Hodarchaeales archaeon]